MNDLQKRRSRIAQAKHRGTKSSHVTELENALLVLAWESEQLSEGQVSRMLNLDRVSLRKMRCDFIDRGMRIAEALASKDRAATHKPDETESAAPAGEKTL